MKNYWSRLQKKLPWWLQMFVAMNVLCIDDLWLIRLVTEGVGYNIALSSLIGDRFLIAAILIGERVRKREKYKLGWLDSIVFHLVGIGVGEAYQISTGWWPLFTTGKIGLPADAIHNWIIAPTLAYLLVTRAITPLLKGNNMEQIAVVVLVMGWAGLLKSDIDRDVLNQRNYFETHGIIFPRR